MVGHRILRVDKVPFATAPAHTKKEERTTPWGRALLPSIVARSVPGVADAVSR